MKKRNYYSLVYFFAFVIVVSCTEKKQEDPKTVDLPKLREKTGGTPDESTTLVSANFKSPEMNCTKGFGLCKVQFTNPTALYPDSTKVNPNEKTYKAIFYLATDSSTLKIEFNEVIPHFEEIFTVLKGDTMRNVLGHEYIIPVQGRYKAKKDVKSKFGRVEIKVQKGKKATEYPEK